MSADGVVNPLTVGNTNITATTTDGNFTASCVLTVLPSEAYKDENDFVYVLDETLNEYGVYYAGEKYVETLSIPNTIFGLDITKVLTGSFVGLEELTTIRLPTSISFIEDSSFVDNYSLEHIFAGDKEIHLFTANEILANDAGLVIGNNNFNETKLPSVKIGGNDDNGDIIISTNGTDAIFDNIDYDIKMNDVSPYKAEGNISVSSSSDAKINIGAHGIYEDTEFTFKKGNETLYSISTSISVYADEYNIAMLTATYPTTIFTLKAPQITNNGSIPTYVMLERYAAYDWDNLQWNIREFPNIAREDATSANNSRFFGNAHNWVKDYISDLIRANSESKFHFYFTDLSIDYFYYTVIAQGIPEEQYNLVMLSDGTASAAILNNTYGIFADGNPTRKHNQLLASITNVKNYLFKNGWDAEYIAENLFEPNGSKSTYNGVPAYYFANHAYSTLCLFDNCEWWLNRLRATENLTAINNIDPNFVTTILGTDGLVQNIYANSLLAGLSEEDATKFKTIFHFDLDSFNVTRENGKKIMVILGTSWSGEINNLYDLMKATMLFFGNEYDYYYKPHPGWPTSTCTDRNIIFDKLRAEGFEFEELDGAVAAEIIMYFNNDIYLCGYSSTTYASLDENNNGMGVCDWTTNTTEYRDYMLSYLSLASDDEKTAYSLDSTKTYYVVHISNNTENAKIKDIFDIYDIAIICLEDSSVTYYKDGIEVNP